jgi:hypothetical protein
MSQPGSINLGVTSYWPTSNGPILRSVLILLSNERPPRNSQNLADTIPHLAVRAKERAQARETLLNLLTLNRDSDYPDA